MRISQNILFVLHFLDWGGGWSWAVGIRDGKDMVETMTWMDGMNPGNESSSTNSSCEN